MWNQQNRHRQTNLTELFMTTTRTLRILLKNTVKSAKTLILPELLTELFLSEMSKRLLNVDHSKLKFLEEEIMKIKKIAILALLLVTAMVLGACASTATTAAPAAETTAAAAETTAAAASGEAEIAIILKTVSSPFWQTMQDGILAKAQELGVKVDVFSANSEDDVQGQLDILENAINKGTYKAIGVAPLSPDNLNNAIAEATKKGIYVANVDEKVNLEGLKGLGGSVFAFVTTDNKAVGAKGAGAIIDALKDGGKVAIIEGKAGNASGEDRRAGAEAAFKAASGFELVESQPADWDRTKALDVATNYLQKHPDLKAIYACNDTMAMGALQAVINANLLGKVLVVGTDGNDDAVASVKAGELYATVAQDPAGIGARSLELLVQALKDKPAISVDVTPSAEFVDSFLVTK